MKQFICLVLAIFLMTACTAQQQRPPAAKRSYARPSASSSVAARPARPASAIPSARPAAPAAEPEQPRTVTADPAWSAEETIAAYFAAHYEGYLTTRDIDISGLLDSGRSDNQNLMVWLKMLNQRRRLLKENDLCYVETEAFDYEIVYDEAAEDDRMEFWQRRMDEQYEAVFHLRIRGEEGKAYPPTFALNAQHSIFLRKIDGAWRVVRHYYPGAVRNFYTNTGLEVKSDEEALALLREEFAPVDEAEDIAVPAGARGYDPQKAVEYALQYAEHPNGIYYNVGDWRGNCQNFVSQAVSSGFGDDANPNPMTYDWFAGSGGGTSAWENCDYFWDYAVNKGGIGGQVLTGVKGMKAGDILQLRSLGRGNPDDFSHVLIMTDPEKSVFAQNSPANFVYCSDLVNIEARFFRPAYLYANY